MAQPSTVREENGELQDPDTGEIPVIRKSDGRYSADPNDPEVARAIHHEHLQEKKQARSRRVRGKIMGSVVAVAIVAVLALGTWAAYAWSQTQYYLASDNGVVTVYQGVPTNIFGYELSHAIEHTDLKVDELPEQWQDRLRQGISVDGYDEALSHVELIRTQFNDLKKEQEQKAKEDADAKAKQQKQANDSKSPTKSAQSR